MNGVPHYKLAIIGTGFAGLGMAVRLRQTGREDFVLLERAGEIGGTWRDNTYPGCACDVQSNLYSFSFAPNPGWSRTFARQPEILEYLRQVARDYGLLPRIRFNHNVEKAVWDEGNARWSLETSGGSLTADFVVSGHGPLAEPRLPDIKGINSFQGTMFHSARWNHSYDLSGKRVAVIGTGASAVQFVPAIQPQVGQMFVFQRTAPWIVPRMDRPFSEREGRLFRRFPLTQRLSRTLIYLQRELSVLGFYHPKMEALASNLARGHLERQIADPELRAKLTPNYRMGCKRIMVSDDFYPALTQPNVELVTEAIREIRTHSVVTADAREREVDAIILGTGFYTAQTPAARIFSGREGKSLWEVWNGSPEAYLGITVSGFPNLFLMVGPNTGLGHNSIVYMIEAQIEYVLGALKYAERHGVGVLEVRPQAQAAFNREIQSQLEKFIWTKGGCTSFYLDASGRNIGLWPGFTFNYRRRVRRFDPHAYDLRPKSAPPQTASVT